MTTIDLHDLAADSPYTFTQLHEANRARGLVAAYLALPTRLRMAVCAELALGWGRTLFEAQALMARLVEEQGRVAA
jgi:hypothetical protein